MATAVRGIAFKSKSPLWSLVSSWVLMIPLLVFASQWGFSFEHASMNSAVGAHSQGSEDSAPMKIQSAVVYLACMFFIMRCARKIVAGLFQDLLIVSWMIWAFLSIGWSQFPMITLVHAAMLAVNVAFAFYLSEHFPTNSLLKLLLCAGWLAALGSLLLVLLLPQYGIQERSSVTSGAWQGIFAQKNTCGFVMTDLLLPSFFLQVNSSTERLFRNAYVALCLLIIVMSRSAGSVVICACCILFIVVMRYLSEVPRKQVVAIAFAVLGVIILSAALICSNFDALMYILGKDPTLTGRTVIWSSLMDSVAKKPFLGYGYTAFWGGLQGESANTALLMHWPGMGYAENGVLELWLELGFVGVCLYMLVFIRAVKDAVYCFMRRPSPAVMWYIASLFYLAATNIEGGKLLSTSDLGFILSVIAFVGLRREARSIRSLVNHEEPNGSLAFAQTL